MAIVPIQVKRGLKADLPILLDGEIGFCTDTLEIFIGNNGVNILTGSTYVHPESHPASMITESADRVFLTSEERTKLLAYKDDYVHIQMIATQTWIVSHGLHKYPSVTIMDSSGTHITADVEYIDIDVLHIHFTAEVGGRAYLS